MNESRHAPIPPSGGAGLNQRLVSSLEALSWASSCLIAVVGLAVLLGWHFNIELLRAGLPGHTPVNPATALALLLAACALWMHHQARGRPDSAPVRWLAVTSASLVIALGVITLTGYFIGHNLRVDQLLFGAQLSGNRVAPNTGFALLLIGVALWLLNSPRRLRRALEQPVVLFPIGVALISLLGYAYSAEGMYGLGELQRMALPTAVALFLFGVGILCRVSRCSCRRSPRASNATRRDPRPRRPRLAHVVGTASRAFQRRTRPRHRRGGHNFRVRGVHRDHGPVALAGRPRPEGDRTS